MSCLFLGYVICMGRQLRPLLIVYAAPRYLVASIVPSSLLWSVHGKISWFLFRVILNNSLVWLEFHGPVPFPLFKGMDIILEGLDIRWGFDCELDYGVICKQSGFAFNGVLQVINIGKKLTRTKERALRDNERTYNVSEVQPPTTPLCERLCRHDLIHHIGPGYVSMHGYMDTNTIGK